MPASNPLAIFDEFFAMCDATRQGDDTGTDQWSATVRQTLVDDYQLDVTDPTIVAAVTAGVVEALSALSQFESPSQAMLAMGWALSDLAGRIETSVSVQA